MCLSSRIWKRRNSEIRWMECSRVEVNEMEEGVVWQVSSSSTTDRKAQRSRWKWGFFLQSKALTPLLHYLKRRNSITLSLPLITLTRAFCALAIFAVCCVMIILCAAFCEVFFGWAFGCCWIQVGNSVMLTKLWLFSTYELGYITSKEVLTSLQWDWR